MTNLSLQPHALRLYYILDITLCSLLVCHISYPSEKVEFVFFLVLLLSCFETGCHRVAHLILGSRELSSCLSLLSS